ncbi:hypothetical protein AB6A40_007307 [Gnathostoma spinigerum]|uniref:Secreted protein n=1 Tax=Gnathostoma spinigerum TaxID=75299 RepID=A0ABD6EL45_9BILA
MCNSTNRKSLMACLFLIPTWCRRVCPDKRNVADFDWFGKVAMLRKRNEPRPEVTALHYVRVTRVVREQ